MFLEEMKTWCRQQFNLDTLHGEELQRRNLYLSKIKHDNFYWCFPIESGEHSIQTVINYVHGSVQDALETVTREEKNKSLQTMFKELNDHTNNTFEYGKNFMAYLVAGSKKMGVDVMSSPAFDGESFERGRLNRMLLQATDSVMKSYVTDMRETEKRIEGGPMERLGGAAEDFVPDYVVDVPEYDDSLSLSLSGALYTVDITDPKGHRWVVKKTYGDFKTLHKLLEADFASINKPLQLPEPFSSMMPSASDHEERAVGLSRYLAGALGCLAELDPLQRRALGRFVDCRDLVLPAPKNVYVNAEAVPNAFVKIKADFNQLLLGRPVEAGPSAEARAGKRKESGLNKDMALLKQTWGVEWVAKIFEAYALLQRMCTVLAWTLEINHFFLSMFGNTLAFSKLPLREILLTQKDIISNFVGYCTDLFQYACALNADSQYKWHKNLHAAENQLKMLRHHGDKSVAIIVSIETEHLDLRLQMRRMLDVASRFQPLMSRVGRSLPGIQQELGLPLRAALPEQMDHWMPAAISGMGSAAAPAPLMLLENGRPEPRWEEVEEDEKKSGGPSERDAAQQQARVVQRSVESKVCSVS